MAKPVRRAPLSRTQSVAHKAVLLHTKTRVVLKTILVLCGAASIAAVAAVLTIQQARIKMTIAFQSPLQAAATARAGDADVSSFGLRVRGWNDSVSLRSMNLALLARAGEQIRNASAAPIDAGTILQSCSLYAASNQRLSGPVPIVSGQTAVFFAMDVAVPKDGWAPLRVLCAIRSDAPPSVYALALRSSSDIRAVATDGPLSEENISFGLAGGPINERGQQMAVVIQDQAHTMNTTANTTSSTSTPSSTNPYTISALHPFSVFGVQPLTPSATSLAPSMTEVLRFSLAAAPTSSISVRAMTFRVGGTDKANAGWLLCDRLGKSAKWGLRESTDPDRRLENAGDWSFYQADGSPCAPKKNLAYAVVDFSASGDQHPFSIGPKEKRTVYVRVDSSEASAVSHDVMRIDLVRRPAAPVLGFVWSDGGPYSDRDPGQNFPVFGTTITF